MSLNRQQDDSRCTFPRCICTAEQRENDCPGYPPRRCTCEVAPNSICAVHVTKALLAGMDRRNAA